MRALFVNRSALRVCLATTIFTGCVGAQYSAPVVFSSQQKQSADSLSLHAAGYNSLYSFKGGRDGGTPRAGVVAANGTLYGTTFSGGAGPCAGSTGCGTIFSISTSGQEHVLYRFKGGGDGDAPNDSLIAVQGNFYGTTTYGGSDCTSSGFSCGTFFSVTAAGKEKVLYRFKGGTDGELPLGALLAINGVLYGTTAGGGGLGCRTFDGCGVIFKVTTSGKEQVLYRFTGYADGFSPNGNLVFLNGSLYGTTEYGGQSSRSGCGGIGCGVVFEAGLSGKEHTLYTFKGNRDGENPMSGLVALNGVLYGTTLNGGGQCYTGSCGTIFSVSGSGEEKILHRFTDTPDGAFPRTALIAENGRLYGTTATGGDSSCVGYGTGCGTVFEVTPLGKEHVLYAFSARNARNDGAWPSGSLYALKGTLYGTTVYGGGASCPPNGLGCGTVFGISL